jgi:phage tail sheath protein FI
MAITASFLFPAIPLRVSASDGDMANPQDAYFGIDTTQAGNNRFDPSYKDMVRVLPDYADSFSTGDSTEFSFVFTLDDLIPTGTVGAVYVSGSRVAENSFTAISASYKGVLNNGFDRFTAPMFGGFDGLDIYEKEPLRNSAIGTTDASNYIYYSLKRAIDTVSDPEVVEMNLLTVPGVTKTVITDHAIKVCEGRGDAMAIIDIEGGYTPNTENTQSETARKGDVTTTVNNMRDRELNTSYGACYYPWVQIKDTISGAQLWAPPSIVALGVLSSAQRRSELWFAPAGFTRGGLSEGAAGLPVTGIRQRLTSKERDKLYEASINPIAQFPAEGIVIFGQKTLQVTPSALDRVNVRRLLIFLKKEISRMAATTLFDQNVSSTWNRFSARARNFLESVKARFGLEDYKLVLDTSTTTPDLIDRNIMYAKIFLKPAKAIEYIAIDFTITNSGASFED